MKVIARGWNWWAYFWRVIHRQTLKGIEQWDEKVVRFIIEVLGCQKGESLLDLGCGSGEHTRLLAKYRIECTGIDIAPSLIKYAKMKARKENVKVEYIVNDMRKIDYENEFDYCIMISGTFGFFSDKENLRLLQKNKMALKSGGKILFDIRNPERKSQYGKSWMAINDGYLLMDTQFNTKTKRENGEYYFIDKTGTINIMSKNIIREGNRIYTLKEIKSMLGKAGLRFVDTYAGFSLHHQNSQKSCKSSNVVIISINPTSPIFE